jgi:hypothetical protein
MDLRFGGRTQRRHTKVWIDWIRTMCTIRIYRAVAAHAVLVVMLGSGSAYGHDDPDPFPEEGDYRVKWYQPKSSPLIEDWEIEVTPIRDEKARFVTAAQVVPEPSCWALDVPIDEPATVRVRALYGNQVSPWSRSTTVPEPGFRVASLVSVALLGGLARRRARQIQRIPRSGNHEGSS